MRAQGEGCDVDAVCARMCWWEVGGYVHWRDGLKGLRLRCQGLARRRCGIAGRMSVIVLVPKQWTYEARERDATCGMRHASGLAVRDAIAIAMCTSWMESPVDPIHCRHHLALVSLDGALLDRKNKLKRAHHGGEVVGSDTWMVNSECCLVASLSPFPYIVHTHHHGRHYARTGSLLPEVSVCQACSGALIDRSPQILVSDGRGILLIETAQHCSFAAPVIRVCTVMNSSSLNTLKASAV